MGQKENKSSQRDVWQNQDIPQNIVFIYNDHRIYKEYDDLQGDWSVKEIYKKAAMESKLKVPSLILPMLITDVYCGSKLI